MKKPHISTLLFLIIFAIGSHSSAQNCSIRDVIAEAHMCDSLGLFLVDISFNYSNIGTQGFEIRGNGTSYGSYNYGQDFYTIGPLEGDCSTLYEFVVIDNSNPNCNSSTELSKVICCDNECSIRDIEIDSILCNDNGTYGFLLDFIHEGTTQEAFVVYTESGTVGRYLYSDLPISIDTFYPRNEEYDIIIICDNTFQNCCAEFEFLSPECDNTSCNIFNLFAEVYPCDSLGVYYVDFEFDVTNPESSGFVVRGNDTVFGEFDYGETFYSIGPFDSCDEINEIVVIDTDNENCMQAIGVPLPDCCDESHDCRLYDLQILSFKYDNNGNLTVVIDFLFEQTGQDSYDIFINGEFNSYNSYNQIPTPILINAEDITDRMVIKICNNDDTDCCAEIVLELESEIDCQLDSLNVLQTECIDGVYYYVINFEYDLRLSFTPMTLRGNGNIYGGYTYDDFPITLGPLDIDDVINELVFIIGEDGDCTIDIPLEPSCALINANTDISSDNIDIKIMERHNQITSILMDKTEAVIYNLSGQVINQTTFLSDTQLPITNLTNGIYILHYNNGTSYGNRKFVVAN